MNNFNRLCPSGNTMVEPTMARTIYIEGKDELRRYIREEDFTFEELKDIVKEFERKGYIEVEEKR
jgi:hypothetical protein